MVSAVAINRRYESQKSLKTGLVKLFAPGVGIATTATGREIITRSKGHYLAAGAVAGTAAIFSGWVGPISPTELIKLLQRNTLHDVCSNVSLHAASQNMLINTGIRLPQKTEKEPFVGAGELPAPGVGGPRKKPLREKCVIQ